MKKGVKVVFVVLLMVGIFLVLYLTLRNTGLAVVATDTSAPLITSISSGGSSSSAVIKWLTNEKSDSLVIYGKAPTNLSLNVYQFWDYVTSHSVSMVISPETTYFYMVRSCDRNHNCATSSIKSFTTLPRPPCTVWRHYAHLC